MLVAEDNLLRHDNFSSKHINITDTSLQNYFVNNSTFHPISHSPKLVTSPKNFTQNISMFAGKTDSNSIDGNKELINLNECLIIFTIPHLNCLITNNFIVLDIEEMMQDVENDESATVTQTEMSLEYTSLRLNPLYINVACWTYLIIMYVIPFIALLLFNLRYGFCLLNDVRFLKIGFILY